jgi:hypothetical protein
MVALARKCCARPFRPLGGPARCDRGRWPVRASRAGGPSRFLTGRQRLLTAPVVRVSGSATLKDRLLDGELALGSGAMRAAASGALDLGKTASAKVRVGVDLLSRPLVREYDRPQRPDAGDARRPFATADYAYRLTSPDVKFDETGFVDVRAEGQGQAVPWPMRVPLHLQARAITGVGAEAGAMLANTSLEGVLRSRPSWSGATICSFEAPRSAEPPRWSSISSPAGSKSCSRAG